MECPRSRLQHHVSKEFNLRLLPIFSVQLSVPYNPAKYDTLAILMCLFRETLLFSVMTVVLFIASLLRASIHPMSVKCSPSVLILELRIMNDISPTSVSSPSSPKLANSVLDKHGQSLSCIHIHLQLMIVALASRSSQNIVFSSFIVSVIGVVSSAYCSRLIVLPTIADS